jgi:hypothetical protein
MKNFPLILIIAFCLQFISGGCDSPSGSKPETVSKPSLVAPNDNETNVSQTPLFQWNGTADKFEIAMNPNFAVLTHSSSISGQQYQLPGGYLQKGTWYYWRVGKTSGQTVDWSEDIFHFQTLP